MAQATALAPARAHADTELENLPGLLGRLGEQVGELVDTKIDLLKVEVKEEANTYLHNGAMMAVGGVIAAIGFALVNVAAALGVSILFANYGLSPPASYAAGFVTTGLFYLIVGGIFAKTMKNRLTNHNPAPAVTIEELRKDKQWLTKEL